MSDTTEHVLALLPGYALGALSAPEAEVVQQHLEVCSSCQEELSIYEAVGADLALAAPLVEPPPELEARLLARVAPQPAPRPAWPARLRDFAGSLGRQLTLRPAWATVAVLALLLMVFLVWNAVPVRSFPTIALAGTDAAPAASGLVVSSEDGLHGTLVVQRLPTLDEETHAYQLWLIEAGAWENGGTFNVDEDGYGARYAKATIRLTDYDEFAVTVEPAGGSETPTGPVVLQGKQ